MSSPRRRQLRPAIIPYWGSNTVETTPSKLVMIVLKVLPTSVNLALYPVVAVLNLLMVVNICDLTGANAVFFGL